MKSIKFSESELDFLKNHYELELSDAENYISEIKNILKKLGVIEKEIAKEKPIKNSGKKRGRPKKEKTAPVKNASPAPAKPGKKSAAKKTKKKAVKPAEKAKPAAVKAEKAPVVKPAPKKKAKKAVKPVKKVNAGPVKAEKAVVVKPAPAPAPLPAEGNKTE